MASPNSKRNKSKDCSDLYSTPEIALDKLFEVVDFSKDKKYFEPCAGIGIVSEYLREKGLYVVSNELFEHGYITEYNEDFLNTDVEFDCDTIVSNPPYKLAYEFVNKGFECAKEQYLLLRLQFLESKKRYEQLFSKGHLKNVYVFVSRISCTEGVEQKETANSVTYCWCHFDKDYVGQPTLHWI